MGIIQLFLIGFGLAMDATAISICKGLKMRKIDHKYMLLISAMFGLFQGLMPLIGYYIGASFIEYISSIDHWVVFILLAIIGGKMIYESFEEENCCEEISYDFKEIILLAIATSIDALAVGLTFAFLNVNVFVAASIIAIVTFVCCVIGVYIGNQFGMKYKSKAEIVGGIILIVIGLKILLEHLNIL